jgi:hypothetical protein
MIRWKRIRLVAGIATLPLIWFFATAHYGSFPVLGVRYIACPPFASVSWGPPRAYIESEGVNAVRDNGARQAGNFLEFAISADHRVSLRLFSGRWFRQEFNGWVSNHRKIAGWLGYRSDGDNCHRYPQDTQA